ncbi:MAG: hypothetical protein R3C59_02825 [Planctomycetaceae bacterium]
MLWLVLENDSGLSSADDAPLVLLAVSGTGDAVDALLLAESSSLLRFNEKLVADPPEFFSMTCTDSAPPPLPDDDASSFIISDLLLE